ncbi:hypothetical protein NPIL_379571 [Nephila pilipes]|uniref:Uncharacterized protein n=1 Tax=Nephila pilipes TaxID=299642 RepID=A0A8X6MMJ7_NEPPI|nr:hypothetical protein NPIL_379571 [Nephila pilipes]
MAYFVEQLIKYFSVPANQLEESTLTPQEKTQCVAWFIENNRNFHTETSGPNLKGTRHSDPTSMNDTLSLCGNMLHKKGTGDPETSDENVECGYEKHYCAVRKSRFVRLLDIYKYSSPQPTWCFTNGFVSMPKRCSCFRNCYQQTNQKYGVCHGDVILNR